ncbi:MAG: dimethyl sulfoxide reductase anchor subunit family protein [Hyphomicrobiaceae bacterium]
MHPAYSVIFFTTASGAGLGLLALLGVTNALGLLPPSQGLGFFGTGLALALLTAGLLSSTAHLGRPERAWRAFSQWRSSWLSREGIAAVATFVPAGLFGMGWGLAGEQGGYVAVSGLAAAALALVTIYTTGMIYASLPTIRAWSQPLTAPVYIVLGLASGAVLLCALLALIEALPAWPVWLAVAGLIAGWMMKTAYWLRIGADQSPFTLADATGLKGGSVRPLDPPHTMANFVMREMGFEVARRHADKLRRIAVMMAFALPAALLVLALAVGGGTITAALAVLAVGSLAAGLFVERWLFFAEARHVSMLYYGRQV